MIDKDDRNPLADLSARDREIMNRLLRMPPEEHKASPKPATAKGDAQRRRRQKERLCASTVAQGL
jgi:hypothetical protein